MALIEVEDVAGIALVKMNRPPANALDPSFLEASARVIDALKQDRPRAVVLTGSGAFFSGGADLKVVPTLSPQDQELMARGSNSLFAGWYGLPSPMVCAVNGHAVAGGLVLALCGDHRVAGTLGQFGLTEVKVGIPYPPSAMAVVQAELTPAAARRLVLRGELMDSKSMLDLGVFDEVVADDQVLDRAMAVAEELAGHPSKSYELIKRSLRREALKRSEDLRSEVSVQGWLLPETAEASAAVLRKDREGKS